ncbi:MAG: sodium:solute symporter [Vicingaceae bacterium]
MNYLDWIVLISCLLFIVGYGTWVTRKNKDVESYLKGGNQLKWFTIGLSVMATQASAITFISTPGLAFEKGMSFVQNYFGLPIALIIVSAFFIPVYYRLKVYTAYEYLEHRFDIRIRLLTASLFLLQRGLAAGITIYAPAIILSTALGWDLTLTIIAVGLLVIIYTVSGGSRAVSVTQKWQMTVILLGMAGVFIFLLQNISEVMSIDQAFRLAGSKGKMNIVSFSLDPSERYTFWTGISGGLFLALSYFGTDQSQVQRYLGGKSVKESRLGLMFNAILKIPMQFFILLTGVLVFLYFEFHQPPALFNQNAMEYLKNSEFSNESEDIQQRMSTTWEQKRNLYENYREYDSQEILHAQTADLDKSIAIDKAKLQSLYASTHNGVQAKESDYVFLYYILNYLPHGIIGLLLCVIISAAMSSTSGEINALAATCIIDFYSRLGNPAINQRRQLLMSRLLTLLWGLLAISFAIFAQMVENLIEAVNILGSLFYGTILGVFLIAFFLKKVASNAVFIAALISQTGILLLFFTLGNEIAYLWHNVIGCVGVIVIALTISLFRKD